MRSDWSEQAYVLAEILVIYYKMVLKSANILLAPCKVASSEGKGNENSAKKKKEHLVKLRQISKKHLVDTYQ